MECAQFHMEALGQRLRKAMRISPSPMGDLSLSLDDLVDMVVSTLDDNRRSYNLAIDESHDMSVKHEQELQQANHRAQVAFNDATRFHGALADAEMEHGESDLIEALSHAMDVTSEPDLALYHAQWVEYHLGRIEFDPDTHQTIYEGLAQMKACLAACKKP